MHSMSRWFIRMRLPGNWPVRHVNQWLRWSAWTPSALRTGRLVKILRAGLSRPERRSPARDAERELYKLR